MEFTGERFLPDLEGEIAYEHWHRYAFAQQLVTGKRVLDIACGEGYGASLLARSADYVIGGDIDQEALSGAHQRYQTGKNLSFARTSCDLLAFAPASFDVVISFETIEHIATQEAMLGEIKRVLKPEGMFCLSSPNKAQYSDARNYTNPFHVKELYREELAELLQKYFPATRWFNQKLLFHSAIWPAEGPVGAVQFFEDSDAPGEQASIGAAAMYFIVLCAATEDVLAKEFTTSFYSDRGEAVYQAYDHAVREVIRLNELLKERERLIIERDQLLAGYEGRIKFHADLIAERDAMLNLRTEQMMECERLVNERDELLTLRTQQMEERERLIEVRDRQLAALRRSPLRKLKRWLKS